MIQGVITAKHILMHPVVLIATVGLMGYMRLLAHCLDSTPRCFVDFILK